MAHQAAAQGLGIALARQTLAQPLIASGRLVPLTRKRLKAEFAHYLVYPPRSEQHAGLLALRDWLLQEARDYTSHGVRAKVRTPAAKPRRRK